MSLKSPIESWSDAKFKGFIVSALRSAFRRWPPKQQCIKAAYRETKINEKTGRMAKHYECKKCKGLFPATMIQADHIKAIVDPKKGFIDFNTWIERGFVGVKKFQALCNPCHKIKSDKERKQRNKL